MNNPSDYLITTSPTTPSRPVDPDNASSWVMLNESGFVKLGNERVLQKLDSRISCELSVPAELRPRCTPFQRKSDRGTLFLTNKRVSSHQGFLNLSIPICSLPSRSCICRPRRLRSQSSSPSAHPSSNFKTQQLHPPCGGDGPGSRTSRPSLAVASHRIFLASKSSSPSQTVA